MKSIHGLTVVTAAVGVMATGAAFASLPGGFSDDGLTTRVSVSSTGAQIDDNSYDSTVSADGRFVAFVSGAALVPGDTNDLPDIFVRDTTTGTTERVSVSSSGEQGVSNYPGNGSDSPSMSPDGRFITFSSTAHNLVPGDTNDANDAFLHDRLTEVTERISVNGQGVQGNADSSVGAVSARGRYVVFTSGSTNLVRRPTGGREQVFVRDRLVGTTRLVSLSNTGAVGDGWSGLSAQSLSRTGRYVVFDSTSSNLVPDDTNNHWDVFVRDLGTGSTERVSVNSRERQARSYSNDSAISGNGHAVAFASHARNLVPGDTNGQSDLFVRNLINGVTRRASLSNSGVEGNYGSGGPALSGNGRYVAFQSQAENLVPADTNRADDVFVRDLWARTTSRVSVDSNGNEVTPIHEFWIVGGDPAISRDGRFVSFTSQSEWLVPDDTNRWADIFLRERESLTP